MYKYYSLYCTRKKWVILTGIRVALLEKRQTSIGTNVVNHEGFENHDSIRLITTPVPNINNFLAAR